MKYDFFSTARGAMRAFSFIIFLEIPGPYEIIGGIIVIGSVYLIQLQDKQSLRL